MDEKERQEIENRAQEFGILEDGDPELNKIRVWTYIQGALDQDPISRKAGRDEIIKALCDLAAGPMFMDQDILSEAIDRLEGRYKEKDDEI